MTVTDAKRDAVKSVEQHRKADLSTGVKAWAASEVARPNRSTTERISEAFATASKKTGAFESRYAKK